MVPSGLRHGAGRAETQENGLLTGSYGDALMGCLGNV